MQIARIVYFCFAGTMTVYPCALCLLMHALHVTITYSFSYKKFIDWFFGKKDFRLLQIKQVQIPYETKIYNLADRKAVILESRLYHLLYDRQLTRTLEQIF